MKIITSEAVFRGHPDKICDQISDAILDECLAQDKNSRVAVECLIKNKLIVVAGEITSNARINYYKIVTDLLHELGYSDLDDYEIIVEVSEQSADIALGVDRDGAGDQGMMYGYACDETNELMPLSITLARKIAKRMDELTTPIRDIFGADGKCQVSILYDKNDNPIKVSTVVVSQQTKPNLDPLFYKRFIINECIKKVIPSELLKDDTTILINPTGEFVIGGSFADCGLTGRKIICDTYGGVGRHGGGAFSGKDTSKVDRLGAYYARYVAKNIVASGIARKCEVKLAYVIGVSDPVTLEVNTFGTGMVSDEEIKEIVEQIFNFTPSAMKKEIIISNIVYKDLAAFGHFGELGLLPPWEKTNKASLINKALTNKQ